MGGAGNWESNMQYERDVLAVLVYTMSGGSFVQTIFDVVQGLSRVLEYPYIKSKVNSI